MDRLDYLTLLQEMDDDEIIDEITQIEMKESLLLISGGLDTIVLLYWLSKKGIPLKAISIDYGQEAKKEIDFAKRHCEKLHVEHETISISENLAGNLGVGKEKVSGSSIAVPFRNQIFLSIASSYAANLGITRVYYGATGELNPTLLDATLPFIHQFNILNLTSDLKEVQVRAPLALMQKEDILELGLSLEIDLRQTWSCFENEETPCGECASCKARVEAENRLLKEYENKSSKIKESLEHYMNCGDEKESSSVFDEEEQSPQLSVPKAIEILENRPPIDIDDFDYDLEMVLRWLKKIDVIGKQSARGEDE